MLEFVDAGFELFQVVEAGLEAVERFDDAGKTLILLLTAGAGLHPAIEGPYGEDENPEFHGASGPGSAGHVFDRKSLQGVTESAGNSLHRYGRRITMLDGNWKNEVSIAILGRSPVKTGVQTPRLIGSIHDETRGVPARGLGLWGTL